MSVELIKMSFYQKLYRKFNDQRHYEHVTLYLYENLSEGKEKTF